MSLPKELARSVWVSIGSVVIAGTPSVAAPSTCAGTQLEERVLERGEVESLCSVWATLQDPCHYSLDTIDARVPPELLNQYWRGEHPLDADLDASRLAASLDVVGLGELIEGLEVGLPGEAIEVESYAARVDWSPPNVFEVFRQARDESGTHAKYRGDSWQMTYSYWPTVCGPQVIVEDVSNSPIIQAPPHLVGPLQLGAAQTQWLADGRMRVRRCDGGNVYSLGEGDDVLWVYCASEMAGLPSMVWRCDSSGRVDSLSRIQYKTERGRNPSISSVIRLRDLGFVASVTRFNISEFEWGGSDSGALGVLHIPENAHLFDNRGGARVYLGERSGGRWPPDVLERVVESPYLPGPEEGSRALEVGAEARGESAWHFVGLLGVGVILLLGIVALRAVRQRPEVKRAA